MGIPTDVRTLIATDHLTESDPVDSSVRTVVNLVALGTTLSTAILFPSVATVVVYWLVASMVAAGAYAAVHEAIHGSLYKTRMANDLAGLAWGVLIMNPYAAYRSFHFQHHVYARSAKDSEPVVEPRNKVEYVVVASATMHGLNLILWRDLALVLAGKPIWYATRTARRGLALVNLLAQVFFIAAVWTIAGGSLNGLIVWWLFPAVIGGVLAGWISFPEHYRCAPGTGDPFRNSRTVRSGRIVRFLVWNANYHTAHHLAPMVTGRNLPVLQSAIDDRCLVVESTYRSFHHTAFATVKQDITHGTAAQMAEVDSAESDAAYDDRAGHRL